MKLNGIAALRCGVRLMAGSVAEAEGDGNRRREAEGDGDRTREAEVGGGGRGCGCRWARVWRAEGKGDRLVDGGGRQ
jgi:hypothetical protein